jgi:pimeloyl-ACP methyl ester carboxylesterase
MMDELDLRDTVVVGISLGAWIAAAIAVKLARRAWQSSRHQGG